MSCVSIATILAASLLLAACEGRVDLGTGSASTTAPTIAPVDAGDVIDAGSDSATPPVLTFSLCEVGTDVTEVCRFGARRVGGRCVSSGGTVVTSTAGLAPESWRCVSALNADAGDGGVTCTIVECQ